MFGSETSISVYIVSGNSEIAVTRTSDRNNFLHPGFHTDRNQFLYALVVINISWYQILSLCMSIFYYSISNYFQVLAD